MSTIKITKAKLTKERLSINYTKTRDDGSHSETSENPEWEVHPDLKSALGLLAIHMAIMTDYVTNKQVKNIEKHDSELCKDFTISGYSIGGDEGDEGIVISGHKILKNGKALILNTPFARFEEGDETRYAFMEDLMNCVSRIEKEVLSYLDGSKKASPAQMQMEFEEQ